MTVFRGGVGRVEIDGQSFRVDGWEMSTKEKPMTEAEWLVCDDPQRMLQHLENSHRGLTITPAESTMSSDRKLRLFACGCVRLAWHLLTDEQSRRAIETAERFADGVASKEETFRRTSSCMTLVRCLMPTWDEREEARAVIEVAHMHNAAILPQYAALLRDIVGNPFRPVVSLTRTVPCDRCNGKGQRTLGLSCGACDGRGVTTGNADWLTPRVLNIARATYKERDWDALPILADALEDAGCDNVELLTHLRSGAPHVRGCWAVDLILGKE